MPYKLVNQQFVAFKKPGGYADEDKAIIATLTNGKAVTIPVTRNKSSMKNRIYAIARKKSCIAHIVTNDNNELIVWLVPNKLVK